MDELTILEKSKAEVTKLESENRRWEEIQSEKLDAKSSNALEYYRRERTAAIKRHTNREEFCTGKITEYTGKLEEQTNYFNKKIKEYTNELTVIKQDSKDYLESSDATITRLSTVNIIKPERIRRNDDTIILLKRKITLMEMDMDARNKINSPGYQYNNDNNRVTWNDDGEAVGLRPKTPPSDTWISNPDQKTLDLEEQIKIARAARVSEPEN